MSLKFLKLTATAIFSLVLSSNIFAFDNQNLSTVAIGVISEVLAISKVLLITSYVVGVLCSFTAILQFKTHKENPQQMSLSRPIVMLIVGASLMFLPNILTLAGASLFGTEAMSAANIATRHVDLSGL